MSTKTDYKDLDDYNKYYQAELDNYNRGRRFTEALTEQIKKEENDRT